MSYLSLNGVPVVLNDLLYESLEDWSRVRSPGRARRRRKRGLPQNIRFAQRPMQKVIQTGGVLYMHPEIWRLLKGGLTMKKPGEL